jgi:hypothetical protein
METTVLDVRNINSRPDPPTLPGTDIDVVLCTFAILTSIIPRVNLHSKIAVEVHVTNFVAVTTNFSIPNVLDNKRDSVCTTVVLPKVNFRINLEGLRDVDCRLIPNRSCSITIIIPAEKVTPISTCTPFIHTCRVCIATMKVVSA